MTLKPQSRAHTIVAVGSINPAIFQPHWFAAHGLIRSSEADSADIEAIHREFASFSLEWCRILATGERLQIETSLDPYFEVARDLLLGVLDTLSHTPIVKLGINWENIYSAPSADAWHGLGHALVPKKPWGPLKNPGTQSVTVRGERNDGLDGWLDVTLSPVFRKDISNGIRIYLNDHFEVARPESVGSAKRAQEILSGQWMKSQERMESSAAALLEAMQS